MRRKRGKFTTFICSLQRSFGASVLTVLGHGGQKACGIAFFSGRERAFLPDRAVFRRGDARRSACRPGGGRVPVHDRFRPGMDHGGNRRLLERGFACRRSFFRFVIFR